MFWSIIHGKTGKPRFNRHYSTRTKLYKYIALAITLSLV